MRILITGGAGFIGGHLADALISSGHDVAVLDDLSSGARENIPNGIPFYQVDIRDTDGVDNAIREYRPDIISHHAAQMSVSRSVRDPRFDADVNILGLINICQSGVRAGVSKIIFASSGGVLYGETTVPAPEESPANPVSPYGISKWAGEKYLQFFSREFGISAIALRYANVYGERQNPHGEAGVVAIFCTRLLNGEQATVNGDGKYIRDYVHVSDVVAANLQVMNYSATGFDCFNIGTGIGLDVNAVGAELLENCTREINKRGLPVTIKPLTHGPERPGDLRSNLLSNAKAKRVLGWSPEVSFDTGAQKTCQWFADRILE